MSESFAVGSKVKFDTNFYGNPEFDSGTGVIERYEECEAPEALKKMGVKCDCGSGGTYFVKIDGSPHVSAYIGNELTAV